MKLIKYILFIITLIIAVVFIQELHSINVLSDGTPWRPLIDVEDMSLAMEWAFTERNQINLKFLAVNIGSNDRNYQVRDLDLFQIQ